jgi:two-component system KDP operon response regulator KdpE
MQNRKVLVIDDDADLVELLKRVFGSAGAQVFGACDGQEGLRQFYAHHPDLVVLDIMMPGMDGWEVCRSLRQLSNVPILVLTALNASQDVLYGLDRGADDYVTKPFDIQILLARARALLRRTSRPGGSEKCLTYDDGYLAIDLEQRRVWVRQQRINLTSTEYELLVYLFRSAGGVLTHEQILEHVWGEGCRESSQYVHVYVHRLRKKLEQDPADPRYLVKEHGVGYRFEPQARAPSLRAFRV